MVNWIGDIIYRLRRINKLHCHFCKKNYWDISYKKEWNKCRKCYKKDKKKRLLERREILWGKI